MKEFRPEHPQVPLGNHELLRERRRGRGGCSLRSDSPLHSCPHSSQTYTPRFLLYIGSALHLGHTIVMEHSPFIRFRTGRAKVFLYPYGGEKMNLSVHGTADDAVAFGRKAH